MTHIHYNVTTTHINLDMPGDNIEIHEVKKPEPVKIPGWMHVDPISTQIDIQSVADQLSDYKFTPGFTVTVEDLTNPKPLDYEATPKYV